MLCRGVEIFGRRPAALRRSSPQPSGEATQAITTVPHRTAEVACSSVGKMAEGRGHPIVPATALSSSAHPHPTINATDVSAGDVPHSPKLGAGAPGLRRGISFVGQQVYVFAECARVGQNPPESRLLYEH
jgi:hypothetical protein